jgi:hypothetical protein
LEVFAPDTQGASLEFPNPDLNIMSNAKVTKSGRTVEMLADGLTIRRRSDHAPVLRSSCKGGVYVLHDHLKVFTSTHQASHMDSAASSDTDDAAEAGCEEAAGAHVPLRLAHERLGHFNVAQVKQLAKGEFVTGFNLTDAETPLQQCTTCSAAMQTSASFPP